MSGNSIGQNFVVTTFGESHGVALGCVVDGSLYESAVTWVANQAAMVQVDGNNPEKAGSGARGMAPEDCDRP